MNENDNSTEAMIQAAGKTAPRLTPTTIQAAIASEYYFTAANGVMGADVAKVAIEANGKIESHIFDDCQETALHLLTICVLVLQNGFTVMGKSACASPENFDANIGRKVARDDAISQVWPLEGYLLKQHLHDQANLAPGGAPADAPASSMPAHQQRVVIERDELAAKITKLQAFFDTPTYKRLADEEQGRLADQVAAMRSYCAILNARIEAFPAA